MEELYPPPSKFEADVLSQFRANPNFGKFEEFYPGKLKEMAEELGWLFSSINRVLYAENISSMPDPEFHSGLLAWNAANSLCAAVELSLKGFPFEPIVLLRNIIETTAVIIHISREPKIFKLIIERKHDGRESIKPAKKIIKVLGGMYGSLCEFSHVNLISAMPSSRFNSDGKTERLIVGAELQAPIRMHLGLSAVMIMPLVASILRNAVEFVFHRHIKDFHFLKREGDYLKHSWSPDEIEKRDRRLKEAGAYMSNFKISTRDLESSD